MISTWKQMKISKALKCWKLLVQLGQAISGRPKHCETAQQNFSSRGGWTNIIIIYSH